MTQIRGYLNLIAGLEHIHYFINNNKKMRRDLKKKNRSLPDTWERIWSWCAPQEDWWYIKKKTSLIYNRISLLWAAHAALKSKLRTRVQIGFFCITKKTFWTNFKWALLWAQGMLVWSQYHLYWCEIILWTHFCSPFTLKMNILLPKWQNIH